MRLQISEEDRELIAYYKGVSVLQDVSAHRIDESNGAIMVTCSDGDQFDDVFQHHASHICRAHRHDSRLHALALNGGSKLIAEGSPLTLYSEDEVILQHIGGAIKLKGIETVVLYVHAPCGAAYNIRLNFREVLSLLFRGKMRVKERYPNVKVACFCHIDDGMKKRTYFASREVWLAVEGNVTPDHQKLARMQA